MSGWPTSPTWAWSRACGTPCALSAWAGTAMAEHHVVAHDLRLAQEALVRDACRWADGEPKAAEHLLESVSEMRALARRYEEVRPRWKL